MLKELKEDGEKVEKILYEQNRNINKEIENLKRNSGTGKYNIAMKYSLEGFKGRFEQAEKDSMNLNMSQWEL